MWHVWGQNTSAVRVWWGSPKEGEAWKTLGTDGRKIPKQSEMCRMEGRGADWLNMAEEQQQLEQR
jgi:hypothetical protein